ncbi:alpha/beta fold hydrolase [Burkholderia pseudomallei]|uniref:alpha/beta fold hydrolase n=1 Tax=Burkholderia pseudomallei TaxID=28450 RepID=UPI00050DD4D4|nr:alpha/beta fold hydrolase [Burkholderia pseudomallei]KGD44841.1 alpha/beta hydrolase fold family protein [Burkholderia pseudomallei]
MSRTGFMPLSTLATMAVAAAISTPAAFAESAPVSGNGGIPSFYRWTDKVPQTRGQMLRTEVLTPRQGLAAAGQNLRILYTSTDGIDGHTPIVVSGALFVPKGTPPQGGWPLMAWAHGTVGSADICAPSYAGHSERDVRYLSHWLAQGYAIVATDYQGLGASGPHPYGLTRPLAYSVLDSIRAVQNGGFELSPKRIVVFGQSQGGRAAFATAVYAKSYAPELDIGGVVATGTPYATIRHRADDAEHSKLHRSVIHNILRLNATPKLLDPSFATSDYLTERATPAFEFSQHACLHAIKQKIASDGLTFENSFKRSPQPVLDWIRREAAYPTLKSAIPIFIGMGGKDRNVPVSDQAALVKDACEAGDRIEWHVYPALDHSETVNGSLSDSTPFVARAFAGEHIDGNCASLPSP